MATSSSATTATPSSGTGQGWLAALEKENGREIWSLPEAMTDPFAGLGRKLRVTLDSFRFGNDPRSLTDWAVAQTGLNDPLTKYNRHELEEAFKRFARERERHLVELVRAARREHKTEVLDQAMQGHLQPSARQALKKAMRG